jgi:hypothetical protein
MTKQRVLLNVKRVKQRPSECSLAASTVLASFYDPSIKYQQVRKLVSQKFRDKGMWTSEQAGLLNDLGFTKITIVTADLDIVDYSWTDLSKDELIEKLKKMRTHYGRARNFGEKGRVSDMIKWLSREEHDNQLKIDQDFPKWIRRYIDNGRPVCASINWTALHKMPKSSAYADGNRDKYVDIGGTPELHSIVVRGYDDDGIFVVDSHTKYYKGRLRRYRNGYYKISWNKFLVNAPFGDLILVG